MSVLLKCPSFVSIIALFILKLEMENNTFSVTILKNFIELDNIAFSQTTITTASYTKWRIFTSEW